MDDQRNVSAHEFRDRGHGDMGSFMHSHVLNIDQRDVAYRLLLGPLEGGTSIRSRSLTREVRVPGVVRKRAGIRCYSPVAETGSANSNGICALQLGQVRVFMLVTQP